MDANTLAIVAALALLVRLGHTLHTMGAVRARSVAAVAARSAIGTACVILVVYFAGRGLAWTSDSWEATDMYGRAHAARTNPVEGLGVFFASPGSFLAIVSIALLPASIVGGATAERDRVRGLLIVVLCLTLLIVPAWLSLGWGAISQLDRPRGDGSYGAAASLSAVARVWPLVVANLVSAAGALTLAKVIGPRRGKYHRDGSANTIPAHHIPTLITGDFLLVLGLPMMAAALAGDPAARVVNALLSASAASLAALGATWLRSRRVDVIEPWTAAIGGAIAGSLSGPAYPLIAIGLGFIVGGVLPFFGLKLDRKARVDDPSRLALPHLFGALAGLTGAAFAGALEGNSGMADVWLLASIAFSGGVVVALVSAGAAAIPAIVLKQTGWLRIDEAIESEGLDLAQHDINAYPDFQQTIIKSYHLRQ